MARVIGEAAIRLRLDPKGLSEQLKVIFQAALKDLDLDTAPFDKVADDAEKNAEKTRSIWARAGSGITSALGGAARAASIAFTAISALGAAAGAAAAMQGLLGVVVALGAALTTMSGALGVLPAAFAGIIALTATLKLGTEGLGDAFKAIAEGDAQAFNEALKDLSPAARAFALEARKLKPAFDSMQLAVQESLFKGLGAELKLLGNQYLPVARDLLVGFGNSLNSAGKQVAGIASTPGAFEAINATVGNLQFAFESVASSAGSVFQAFLDITEAGSTTLPGIADTVSRLADRFSEFISGAAESGKLAAFFQAGVDAVGSFLGSLGNLAAALFNVFRIAEAQGAGLLNTFATATQAFRTFTESASGQSAIAGLFTTLREVVTQLIPIFLEVAKAIGAIAPIATQVLAVLGPAFLSVFQQLTPIISALAPTIALVSETFGQLLNVLAPLLPMVAQLVGAALQPLMSIIIVLLPPFQQLIQAILPPLLSLFQALSPVLIAVASVVGALVGAITPLLPPIISLITSILPPFVELFNSLTPVIQLVAGIITGVVVPAFNFLAGIIKTQMTSAIENVKGAIDKIVAVFSFLRDITVSVWNAIVGFIRNPVDTIKNLISSAGSFIRGLWDGMINGIKSITTNGFNAVIGFFKGLGSDIVGAIKGFIGSVVDIGGDIIGGLLRGLKSAAGAVGRFLIGMIKDAVGGVLSFLGISSPSKLFIGIGKDTMQGLIVGADSMDQQVRRSFESIAATAADSMVTPLSADANGFSFTGRGQVSGGSAASAPIIYNQTNLMQPGTDVRQFADQVYRRGASDLAAAGSLLSVSQQPVQVGVNDQRVNGVRI